MDIRVLYEDAFMIVVVKPCGIPSQPDKTGDEDMLGALEKHLIKQGEKNPYVGLIHRLDRPVGGVMVFAKTKEADGILSKVVQQNQVSKEYLAVLCGCPQKTEDRLQDFLWKDGKRNLSKVISEKVKGAKEALLEYKVMKTVNHEIEGELSLVNIRLLTGRHHQIRVQFSHAGFGIWGDKKYNTQATKRLGKTQVALWSTKLSFKDPRNGTLLVFEARPEAYPFSIFLNEDTL